MALMSWKEHGWKNALGYSGGFARIKSIAFASIAMLAVSLRVFNDSLSTFGLWDDMIKVKTTRLIGYWRRSAQNTFEAVAHQDLVT